VEKKLEDRRGIGAGASLIALYAVQSVPLLLVTVNLNLTVCIHMYQSRYERVSAVSGVDEWVKLFLHRPGQATEVSRRLRLQEFPDNRHINLAVCHPYAPAAFTPIRHSYCVFLLDAESTPWTWRGRKD
jgi:hypothetical protein